MDAPTSPSKLSDVTNPQELTLEDSGGSQPLESGSERSIK